MNQDIVPMYHDNPSQRTPCMLVLDASGSMDQVVAGTGRTRIEEVNQGLLTLQQELLGDDTAAQRVQLAIVGVGGPAGGADLLLDWTDAAQFEPPRLRAGGMTPLAQGMRLALQHVEEHKRRLKANGVAYTRPWIMIISDGAPTDEPGLWEAVRQECRAAEADTRCLIYPIGVADANMKALEELSTTPALKLHEAKFREYFRWLSSSLQSVSNSRPNALVQLQPTSQWTSVSA